MSAFDSLAEALGELKLIYDSSEESAEAAAEGAEYWIGKRGPDETAASAFETSQVADWMDRLEDATHRRLHAVGYTALANLAHQQAVELHRIANALESLLQTPAADERVN